jgi:hypothetical protein
MICNDGTRILGIPVVELCEVCVADRERPEILAVRRKFEGQ